MLKQNVPLNYHISRGADGVYWILNNGENFVKNLSIDHKKAQKKAIQYIKKHNPDFFKDGRKLNTTVWFRRKIASNNYKGSNQPVYLDAHIREHFWHLLKLDKAKKIEEAKNKYFHVGQVGDLLELELTITNTFGFQSNYGYCLAHKFVDADNNSLIYFGNSKELCENDKSKFKVGDKITVIAEIKKHTKDQRDLVYNDNVDQVMKPLTIIAKPKLITTKGDK